MKSSYFRLCALAVGGLAASLFLPHGAAHAQQDETRPLAWASAHRLSETRLLRRGYLTLMGRAPTVEEYESLLELPVTERRAEVLKRFDEAMDSPEFADQVLRWGMEYLRIVSYDYGFDFVNRQFYGHYSLELNRCADDTLHAGSLGNLSNYDSMGEPYAICNDPNIPKRQVEPWWAPGTTVSVIGASGLDVREVDGVDCGRPRGGDTWAREGCSCGPNLVYCTRQDAHYASAEFRDDSNFDPVSIRRSVFEEPARLFRYVITQDRPFSDLIVGNYTTVNRGLAFLYVRNARQNRDNIPLDDTTWWRDFTSDDEWREFTVATLHPDLLAERDYKFDPRTNSGRPEGVPAAGVLTMLGANASFSRERVRAARWLETFACRDFAPPPPDIEFTTYLRDPGYEGICQHCHQVIDPAAMYFKRMFGGGAQLGGVGDWDLAELAPNHNFRKRSEMVFEYDTLMTPVPQATLETNPNAGLIDFMPEDYSLFGTQGDGTIGPLGFGKVLVESGEFDRCAVRRFHKIITGRDLIPGQDDRRLDDFVDAFVASDRNVRRLLRAIVSDDQFTIGW